MSHQADGIEVRLSARHRNEASGKNLALTPEMQNQMESFVARCPGYIAFKAGTFWATAYFTSREHAESARTVLHKEPVGTDARLNIPMIWGAPASGAREVSKNSSGARAGSLDPPAAPGHEASSASSCESSKHSVPASNVSDVSGAQAEAAVLTLLQSFAEKQNREVIVNQWFVSHIGQDGGVEFLLVGQSRALTSLKSANGAVVLLAALKYFDNKLRNAKGYEKTKAWVARTWSVLGLGITFDYFMQNRDQIELVSHDSKSVILSDGVLKDHVAMVFTEVLDANEGDHFPGFAPDRPPTAEAFFLTLDDLSLHEAEAYMPHGLEVPVAPLSLSGKGVFVMGADQTITLQRSQGSIETLPPQSVWMTKCVVEHFGQADDSQLSQKLAQLINLLYCLVVQAGVNAPSGILVYSGVSEDEVAAIVRGGVASLRGNDFVLDRAMTYFNTMGWPTIRCVWHKSPTAADFVTQYERAEALQLEIALAGQRHDALQEANDMLRDECDMLLSAHADAQEEREKLLSRGAELQRMLDELLALRRDPAGP